MITVEGLFKEYAGHKVIEVPNLNLDAGIHWFKGRNGSGKTTFFKILSGILPFEGKVTLAGLDIRKDPVAYRFAINYGEAEPNYPEFLTANDLIGFVAKTKKADKNQVEALVEKLGITPFLYQTTGTYSSGMLKKLSLAIAFLGTPKVIILDEPLITIDDQTVEVVYDMVRTLHAEGTTFLLSSHQDFRFQALPINGMYLVENKMITEI